MLDLRRQEQVMLDRLAYYRKTINERSEEYRQFKVRFSIPRIRRALEKIAEGTYQTCDDCGGQITDLRLKTVPAALKCIDCQKKEESRS